jgi:hypothetical protein
MYTWPISGQTYTASGVYSSTSLNAAGCTHTNNLNLTINHTTVTVSSLQACDSYTWAKNGTTYTASGNYYFIGQNAQGCPDVYTLSLTVNYSSANGGATITSCDSYTWNGSTYTTSGVYTYTTLNASGCTNTATLNLTVNYSSANGDATITSCDSYSWNG